MRLGDPRVGPGSPFETAAQTGLDLQGDVFDLREQQRPGTRALQLAWHASRAVARAAEDQVGHARQIVRIRKKITLTR